MANTITPYIQFTADVGSNHLDGCVPMLDFAIWGEMELDSSKGSEVRWVTRWKYFQKSMTSKLVLMEASPLAHRVKVTTLTQEVVKRMTRNDKRTTTK